MWPVCQVLAGKLVCPLFTYANQTVQGECELVDGRVVLHGEATYTVAGTATLAAIGWERIVFAGTFEHGHFTSGEIRFNDEQYYRGDLCVGDKPPAQMQHCICEIGEMQFHDDDAALALELWHYHGGFQRGLFHGQGELTLYMGNDDIFEGTFKNGEFCSGKITHTDGSVHEGTFHCAGAPMACMCSSRRTAVSSPPRTAASTRAASPSTAGPTPACSRTRTATSSRSRQAADCTARGSLRASGP